MNEVIFYPEFEQEFMSFEPTVQRAIFAYVELLKSHGSTLKRPYCDTLKSARYKNLKELRITVPSGEWRVSFAFDPKRKGVLLVAGSKSGISQTVFYNKLITVSEKRYEQHLANLNETNL